MASDALKFADVNAFYGDSHVLYGVSFALQEGRVLGLLGRNGAGKTTCLSTAIGFLKPRSGSISLFGEAIERNSIERNAGMGLAIVPQGRRIFPSLSVSETLAVAEQRRTWPNISEKWSADRIYQLFPRLEERKNQTAGFLSGGEQQMLAIGRALMSNPRTLLMDEPSEGLAPQIVAEIGKIIQHLKTTGISVILVEQNIKLALSLCDDFVVLNSGSVAFQGTHEQLCADQGVIDRNLGIF